MQTAPLVSVLIPCYNHEKYVSECLDSILDSDYKNIEIVVIDDGSTDSSAEIIMAWIKENGSKISVNFITRENHGFTKTLNQLIEVANGDYLTVLASDDKLTKQSIKIRLDALISKPNKHVVIGDARVIDSNGDVILQSAIEDLYFGKKTNYGSDESLKYSVIYEWSIPGPVMMAKKEIYSIIGRYPENLLAEDLNFYLQVIGREKLFFIDEIVALYRVHDLNMCRVPSNQKRIISSIIKSYFNNIKYYSFKYKIAIFYRILKHIYRYFKAPR